MKSLFLLLIFRFFDSTEASHVDAPTFSLTQQRNRRRRQIGRHTPFHDSTTNAPPFTILNLTCSFISQPLNHFDLPRNASGTYQQRYCYYDGFENTRSTTVGGKAENVAPIFLYIGNESPIETYINHTGLMWELAPQFGAIVVFLEHRYEGESIPDPSTTLPPVGKGCMAYSSSIQALADASYFIQNVLFTSDKDFSDAIQPFHFNTSSSSRNSFWWKLWWNARRLVADEIPINGSRFDRGISTYLGFTASYDII
jgi:Serine carboxypeptidase S28